MMAWLPGVSSAGAAEEVNASWAPAQQSTFSGRMTRWRSAIASRNQMAPSGRVYPSASDCQRLRILLAGHVE